MFKNNKFKPLKALFFFGVFVLIVGILSWLVMFLWNAILPETVGVKPLTYWKAMGLLVLSKILFGGFGRGRRSWKGSSRKKRFSKWMSMSEEERREAKERWKKHCQKKTSKDPDNQSDEKKM